MKQILTKIFILLLALTAGLSIFPAQSYAAGKINTDHEVKFTVRYLDGTLPVDGARFELYLAAKTDEYARLTVTEEFSKFPVDYDEMTQENWQELATTLRSYVQMTEALAPAASGLTDGNGSLTLSLRPGLYLAIGYRATTDDYNTYSASPFMVFLPGADATTGDWVYEVTSTPKFTKAYNPSEVEDRYITRKVILTWDDAGCESTRPEYETVMLFRDGELYDTVLLSESNNWRYSWDNLDPDHEWVIAQVDPNGYTVKLTDSGITRVIRNKIRPATPTPTPCCCCTKLPQTGVLWWPVPVLGALGLVLIVIGISVRRGRDE